MTGGRPRLGVLFLSSGWMTEVGLQPIGSTLVLRQQEAAARIRRRLADVGEIVAPPPSASPPDASRAGELLAAAGCDLILVAPLVWCEDQVLRAALAPLAGQPLLLCTFLPGPRLPVHVAFADMLSGSAVVGTLQASGMLAREGWQVASVNGTDDDPAFYAAVQTHARARAALRSLHGARVGILPFRSDAMSVTWVDEFALRARLGLTLVPLECSEVARRAASVGGGELASYRAALDALDAAVQVPARDLERGMRCALAIESIAMEADLQGMALNDIAPELHAALGMRPCLPSFRLCQRGFVVSMEADVAACVVMLLLRLFLDVAPFYGEILNVGRDDNVFLLGHAGWHDPVCRDPSLPLAVVPDEEYRGNGAGQGAALVFKHAPGPVTAVNAVYDGRGLRFTSFEGESLPGPARMDGGSHLVCRPDRRAGELLDAWIERGVSQHWVVVPGRQSARIACLSRWAGVPYAC